MDRIILFEEGYALLESHRSVGPRPMTSAEKLIPNIMETWKNCYDSIRQDCVHACIVCLICLQ